MKLKVACIQKISQNDKVTNNLWQITKEFVDTVRNIEVSKRLMDMLVESTYNRKTWTFGLQAHYLNMVFKI